ncbi:MAG: replication factor C large subunit, partial [Candidatus Jordarchaeales archaeon]
MSRVLWVEKYAPKKVSEIVENRRAAERVAQFIANWRADQTPRALLLWGPAGVGKTASVYAAANELGYDLIEVNASDKRTLEDIQRTVGVASSFSSLVSKERRIILIDEVDGISGSEDKGGISGILEILKKTIYPVILIANDAWDPKLAPIREYCELVKYDRIRSNVITSVLARICEKEGIEADPVALRKIAENAKGDLRAAINDLQAVAEGKRRISVEDVEILSPRDQEKSVFDTLKAIFYGKSAKAISVAASMADVDHELLIQWICENAWQHMQTPRELANAYDALSKAD